MARELGIQWGGAYKGKSGDKNIIISGRQGDTATGPISDAVDVTAGSVVDLPALAIGSFNPYDPRTHLYAGGGIPFIRPTFRLAGSGKTSHSVESFHHDPGQQTRIIESGEDVPYQSVGRLERLMSSIRKRFSD